MAVVLVVMAVLGLVIAGSVQPLSQEADLAAVRVETTRAFFAAESGVAVVIGLANAGLELPAAGDETRIGLQTVRFIEVPDGAGELVIEGASGLATRRVQLTIE
jgi:hypothetical protein